MDRDVAVPVSDFKLDQLQQALFVVEEPSKQGRLLREGQDGVPLPRVPVAQLSQVVLQERLRRLDNRQHRRPLFVVLPGLRDFPADVDALPQLELPPVARPRPVSTPSPLGRRKVLVPVVVDAPQRGREQQRCLLLLRC